MDNYYYDFKTILLMGTEGALATGTLSHFRREHKIKFINTLQVFNSDEYIKWEDYVKEELELSERTLSECDTNFYWDKGGYTYGEWRFLNLGEMGVIVE